MSHRLIIIFTILALALSTTVNAQEIAVVGQCNTPGGARGVVVSGNYAYIADHVGGLLVIDISDPSNPHEVGSSNAPMAALT